MHVLVHVGMTHMHASIVTIGWPNCTICVHGSPNDQSTLVIDEGQYQISVLKHVHNKSSVHHSTQTNVNIV